jgi:hypothetical protein
VNRLDINSISILGGIIDKIAQLETVNSVLGRENQTKQSIIIDDITLEPNSIYLCILGGYETEIANILTEKKTLGAYTNGNTQISIYDEAIDFAYIYNIQRPTIIQIVLQITYKPNIYSTPDVENRLKNEIMTYINANPFSIGENISANIIDKSVNEINYIDLLNVKIGFVVNDLSTIDWQDYISITISQIAQLIIGNIYFVKNE